MSNTDPWWAVPDPETFGYVATTELHMWSVYGSGGGSLRIDLFKAYDDSKTWTFKCKGLSCTSDTGMSELDEAKLHAVEFVTQFIGSIYKQLQNKEQTTNA